MVKNLYILTKDIIASVTPCGRYIPSQEEYVWVNSHFKHVQLEPMPRSPGIHNCARVGQRMALCKDCAIKGGLLW